MHVLVPLPGTGGQGWLAVEGFKLSQCSHCKYWAVWNGPNMVFPSATTAPLPSADMPPDVAQDFSEARATFPHSARASAALLRLAVQKLCTDLGPSGKDLNADIAVLAKVSVRP